MKRLLVYLPLILPILFFAASTGAQTRRAERHAKPRPAATPSTFTSTLEINLAKQKVSNQVSNLKRFTDVLGPVAATIESFDTAAKSSRPSRAAVTQNNTNKQNVRTSIKNLRAGLVDLETEFRSKAGLRQFLPKLDGISMLAAESEDLSFAGRFTDSRRPLLAVLQKLSDALAAMP